MYCIYCEKYLSEFESKFSHMESRRHRDEYQRILAIGRACCDEHDEHDEKCRICQAQRVLVCEGWSKRMKERYT